MCFASGGGRGRRYLEHGSLSGISAKVNPFLFQRQNANAIAAERIIRFSFYRNRDLPILKEKIARHASIGEYECSGNSSTHKVFTPLPNQVSFCFSLRFVHGSRLLKYSKRTAPNKKPNKANNFSDATCIATDDLRERVKNVHFYILQVRHAPLCACVPYHLSVCDTLEQHCWLHSWFSFSLCRRKRRNRKTRFKFRLQWVVLFRCTFVNSKYTESRLECRCQLKLSLFEPTKSDSIWLRISSTAWLSSLSVSHSSARMQRCILFSFIFWSNGGPIIHFIWLSHVSASRKYNNFLAADFGLVNDKR